MDALSSVENAGSENTVVPALTSTEELNITIKNKLKQLSALVDKAIAGETVDWNNIPGEENEILNEIQKTFGDSIAKLQAQFRNKAQISEFISHEREEELEKLVMAATQSFNSVIITDSTGQIEWVNEGFSRLTGYQLSDVKGTTGQMLRKHNILELEQKNAIFQKIAETKTPQSYENKNFSKTGKEFWVITTLTPVLDEKGNVKRIIAIDSDITQRKQMEEELKLANKITEHSLKKGNQALDQLTKAKKQVEQTIKMKEKFMANMSHEIRTPMNGIIGLTDVLLKTSLTHEQREYLTAIKSSGNTLMVVINDVLDISKIEAGKMTFERIPFKVSSVINTIIDLFSPKAEEKKISLKKVIDPAIPKFLLGDQVRLNQILMNLVSNAVKFTQSGEVILSASLDREDDENTFLKFVVKDTGRGIPEDRMETLFDDFTQASSDITRKYGGTGLGLSISKRLVELQGGIITVKSKENVGSEFIIKLKFGKVQETEEFQDVIEEENYDDLQLPPLDILLVEDNPVNQLLAQKLLFDWGCNVDTADNGKIAVQKLTDNSYDIVLMDIKMPEMDGYEATQYIRTKLKAPVCNIPILALTAHAATWEAEKCIEAGMNDYISKPFNIKEFFKLITKYSRNKVINKAEKRETALIKTPVVSKINEQKKEKEMRHTDLSYLRSISRGSKEFIVKLINSFITQTSAEIEKLKQHLQAQNWEGVYATAHKMKPSFHFVGLKELKEPIQNIETYAKEKSNLSSIPELVSQVVAVCNTAINELKEEIEKLK